MRIRIRVLPFLVCLAGAVLCTAQTRQTVVVRGHEQTLYLYGSPGGDPVIVSSGDGGWIHLGPSVAEFLSSRGFSVTGFDARAYLTSFTAGASTLRPEDVPADFKALVQRARGPSGKKPILVGVSEGAGLAILAASDNEIQSEIAGVIGLGVPGRTELGWRLRDSLIYFTHKTPDEPTVSTAAIVDKVSPLPFAAIHSTNDEFVPVADIQNIFTHAHDPKKLWIVAASNHRFSSNPQEFQNRLLEAITWVRQNTPH
jgi:alpha-beta hydrolase superfamily lysophospholipase